MSNKKTRESLWNWFRAYNREPLDENKTKRNEKPYNEMTHNGTLCIDLTKQNLGTIDYRRALVITQFSQGGDRVFCRTFPHGNGFSRHVSDLLPLTFADAKMFITMLWSPDGTPDKDGDEYFPPISSFVERYEREGNEFWCAEKNDIGWQHNCEHMRRALKRILDCLDSVEIKSCPKYVEGFIRDEIKLALSMIPRNCDRHNFFAMKTVRADYEQYVRNVPYGSYVLPLAEWLLYKSDVNNTNNKGEKQHG